MYIYIYVYDRLCSNCTQQYFLIRWVPLSVLSTAQGIQGRSRAKWMEATVSMEATCRFYN